MLKLSKEGSTSYIVHRPNTGVLVRPEKLKVMLKAYEKVRGKEKILIVGMYLSIV